MLLNEQNPPWEADSRSDRQVLRLYRNLNVHINQLLIPITSQVNPIHIPVSLTSVGK
jgi:hypothetical protein